MLPRSTATTIFAATTTVVAGVATALLVKKYGIEGTFWYIWEGDPYPPWVRFQFEELNDVSIALTKETKRLDSIECALEKAKLDGIDDTSPIPLWIQYVKPESLEQKLAGISYNLDVLAADVDKVMSNNHEDIKLRKKVLSDEIVSVMTRTDALITLYKQNTIV